MCVVCGAVCVVRCMWCVRCGVCVCGAVCAVRCGVCGVVCAVRCVCMWCGVYGAVYVVRCVWCGAVCMVRCVWCVVCGAVCMRAVCIPINIPTIQVSVLIYSTLRVNSSDGVVIIHRRSARELTISILDLFQ